MGTPAGTPLHLRSGVTTAHLGPNDAKSVQVQDLGCYQWEPRTGYQILPSLWMEEARGNWGHPSTPGGRRNLRSGRTTIRATDDLNSVKRST